MMQDPTSKGWSLAVITRLCKELRSYQVTTADGVTYRKTQAHLKPYKQEGKKEQEAKNTICGHLQIIVIRTLVITIWHNQELGGKLSPL